MRTLFLICILGALIVIAAKDPGETVFDVANDFAEEASQIVDRVETSKSVSTSIASILEQPEPDTDSNFSLDDIMKDPEFGQNGPEEASTLYEYPPQTAINQMSEDNPASETDGWQGLLPTEPVPEMNVAQFPVFSPDFSTTSAPEVSPVLNAQDTYSEVKNYYENASQLLSEIE
jgi:hypothetical protein